MIQGIYYIIRPRQQDDSTELRVDSRFAPNQWETSLQSNTQISALMRDEKELRYQVRVPEQNQYDPIYISRWGRNKSAATLQMVFSNSHLLVWKLLHFASEST